MKYAAQYANGGNFGVNYGAIVGAMDEGVKRRKIGRAHV